MRLIQSVSRGVSFRESFGNERLRYIYRNIIYVILRNIVYTRME